MHDDDNFDGYEDDVNDHINNGFHNKENVEIKIQNDPPTVEFSPQIVTRPTVPPETQRTFHNGMLALIALGVILLMQTFFQVWQGQRGEARDRAFIDELKELNAEVQRVRTPASFRSDTENGMMPIAPIMPPKDKP